MILNYKYFYFFYPNIVIYQNNIRIFVYNQTKTKAMKTTKLNIRGTEMNRVDFSEIEDLLENKGVNVREANNLMANDNDQVFVSNGFLSGLTNEITEVNEWHHYFVKQEDGSFEAFKLNFYNI